jgi:potassium channel subfamily K member 18
VAFDEHGDIPSPPLEISDSPAVLSRRDAILDDCRCFCSWKRFHRDCCRVTLQFLFSQIGLFILVFAYILFGGWMFSIIESRHETRQQEQLDMTYTHGIDRIRQIVNDEFNWMLNASFELRYALWRGMLSRLDEHDYSGWRVQVNIERFDQLIEDELAQMEAEQEKLVDKHDMRTDAVYNQKWTYSTAVLYCATVVTTVGYGHIAPKSILGKVVTCLYAMIGIPIMIASLTTTGDLLAFIFIKYYTKTSEWIKRVVSRRQETKHRPSTQVCVCDQS